MSHFHPPNLEAGDANTVGGYRAVHSRPAAFEGKDGASYSVEVVADEPDTSDGLYGAYLLFVRWGQGDPIPAGHLETGYLAHATSEAEVVERVSATMLNDAKAMLDMLIDAAKPPPSRPWYEAMHDE